MVNLSHGGRISDPVHGYVNFTGIERAIIDHRVTERLRYVSQNGLAHLVFPEVRTSRFSHSLGAMHLASQFLAASLRNTDGNTQEQLLQALKDAVIEAAGKVAQPERAARTLEGQMLVAQHYCPANYRPYLLLAEQGLRLAALFHDLGHLPFSHDFETSLEELWRAPPNNTQSALNSLMKQQQGLFKIHERVGHSLALLLFQDVFAEVESTPQGGAARISFEFAQQILESTEQQPEPREAAVLWLHSLVDGELDVDRCDYILRDARNHGFEFATYDLSRLLNNLVVAAKGKFFVLAVKPHGLSAVETYLISRYRSHQYGIRHHKVAQVGAALRYSIAHILGQPPNPTVEAFVRDLGGLGDISGLSIDERKDLLNRFTQYDDIWWTNVMRTQAEKQHDEWLDLVCWRQSGPWSLWKRTADFPGQLREFNQRLPEKNNDIAQRRWSATLTDLKDEGILVVRHFFSPWEVDLDSNESTLCIQQKDGKMDSVSKQAPLVRALREAWKDDIQVQAFARSDCQLSAGAVLDRLEVAQGG